MNFYKTLGLKNSLFSDMHKKSRLKCGFETAYYPIILFTLKRQGYYQPGFCVRLVFISVSCLGIGHT